MPKSLETLIQQSVIPFKQSAPSEVVDEHGDHPYQDHPGVSRLKLAMDEHKTTTTTALWNFDLKDGERYPFPTHIHRGHLEETTLLAGGSLVCRITWGEAGDQVTQTVVSPALISVPRGIYHAMELSGKGAMLVKRLPV